MNRIKTILLAVVILAAVGYGGWIIWRWGFCRVFVGPNEALVVINRYGKPLPPGLVVVPPDKYDEFQGIHQEVLGPGRYFLNPVLYDTKIVPLERIPAGDPARWDWDAEGELKDPSLAPQIGLVTMKQGKTAPPDSEVVDAEYKGIQKDVLTPGTYKINPYLQEVKLLAATVIPPGSVGVRTRLYGDRGAGISAALSEVRAAATSALTGTPATNAATKASDAPKGHAAPTTHAAPTRLVSGDKARGILDQVLQPGIYYLNPRLYRVSIIPVGYDAITLEHPKNQVRFYSADGYLIEADFTVVWGRSPGDAPHIVANIGDIQKVQDNVLEPAMKASCQNEGAKYTAKQLIQGDSRSKFQDDLQASLERQVAPRNVHVLLALIRNVSVKDTIGRDQTEGLLATIQRANIEIEVNITNEQRTRTAETKALLEQSRKLVDVARETVASETNVKVANIRADGQKKSAEIDAQRELTVAEVELQIARLSAQREQILGKAAAQVEQLKREAEAKGAKMLVDALGGAQAYNQYLFARNFEPHDLRLIYAGPGTFWTDLKTFQEAGAAKVLQQAIPAPKIAMPPKGAVPPNAVPR